MTAPTEMTPEQLIPLIKEQFQLGDLAAEEALLAYVKRNRKLGLMLWAEYVERGHGAFWKWTRDLGLKPKVVRACMSAVKP